MLHAAVQARLLAGHVTWSAQGDEAMILDVVANGVGYGYWTESETEGSQLFSCVSFARTIACRNVMALCKASAAFIEIWQQRVIHALLIVAADPILPSLLELAHSTFV